MRKYLGYVAAVMVSAAVAGPVQAQQQNVNVKLTPEVAQQVAKQINAETKQIPKSVQVPANVAEDVCQMKNRKDKDCTAQTTTDAFNKIVKEKVKG